ncbi:MAG: hypothetical protein ACTHJU_01410 [Sphingopyxis sp.]
MAKSEPVDLFSPLSPEAIAHKLQTIMADPMKDAKARVFGSGDQYVMRLHYARRDVQNPMALELEASMEPHEGGTRIAGTLGRSTAGRMFPFIWFGFLSVFVAVGVAISALVPGTLMFGAIFAGIPILMMAMGGAAIKAATNNDEGDREEILRFMSRELQTRPIA